ncbi:hypothetical protein HBB16_12920, partial [Pseudonocardia sp. MCCB 268]|nr:hypothetical protein [Pseudonocardia cytotoxica]
MSGLDGWGGTGAPEAVRTGCSSVVMTPCSPGDQPAGAVDSVCSRLFNLAIRNRIGAIP